MADGFAAVAAHVDRSGRPERRVRAWVCAVALVAAGGWLLAWGHPAHAGELPLELSEITFVSTRGPVTEIVLQAESAIFDEGRERADLRNVRARLSHDDGSLSLALDCEEGEFDLDTRGFLAKGQVRGVLGDGRRFEGPWLRYDPARGLAFTDGAVRITEGARTLRGGGFRYHVREGRLVLTSGASVVEGP